MRIGFSGSLLVLALASQTACLKPPPPVNVYRMGDKVQVGPLIYNVFETKWLAQIGEGPRGRAPAHRFLVMHVMIVNSGAETLPVPSFKLQDEAGGLHNESMEGQDVTRWLGMIRNLKPADTLEGNILFDVDPKSYKLKLDDGSETGKVLMVDLPLEFEANKPPLAPDPLSTPGK
jgi:hypothetical protein